MAVPDLTMFIIGLLFGWFVFIPGYFWVRAAIDFRRNERERNVRIDAQVEQWKREGRF